VAFGQCGLKKKQSVFFFGLDNATRVFDTESAYLSSSCRY